MHKGQDQVNMVEVYFMWFPSRNSDLVSKSTKDSCIRNFGLVQEAQIMNLYSKTQTNQGILSYFFDPEVRR